jgi:hypothetical protein
MAHQRRKRRTLKTPEERLAASRETNREYMARARAKDPEKFRARDRAWIKSPRGQASKMRRRGKAKSTKSKTSSLDSALRLKYGVGIEWLWLMLSIQKNLCAICGQPETHPHYTRLSVDHNHKTGNVRALLCNGCNRLLGYARESPEILRKAALYLETHNDPAPTPE